MCLRITDFDCILKNAWDCQLMSGFMNVHLDILRRVPKGLLQLELMWYLIPHIKYFLQDCVLKRISIVETAWFELFSSSWMLNSNLLKQFRLIDSQLNEDVHRCLVFLFTLMKTLCKNKWWKHVFLTAKHCKEHRSCEENKINPTLQYWCEIHWYIWYARKMG